jgi:N-formylglutamate amidohydrolase
MKDAFNPAFTIHEPSRLETPLIFSVPHSGRVYPDHFIAASRLDPLTLRRSEDAYVDELVAGVVGLGAPLITAHFPRAYLDLNREPYELDPRLFDQKPPAFANTQSLRVAGGLGTIPRVVGDGQDIYRDKISLSEGLERISQLHRPYHHALQRLMTRATRQFGAAVLIDCHSMPVAGLHHENGRSPDVILGDRFGSSCATGLADRLERSFHRAGLQVSRNRPYAGGYITEHYGKPHLGQHAIQVEIARRLYMDERTIERGLHFGKLTSLMTDIFCEVATHIGDDIAPITLAAE